MNIDLVTEHPEMVSVVERNVHALLNRKKEDRNKRNITEKFVAAVTSFAGSISSIVIHSILFGIWICWNTGLLGLKPFDSNFIMLATFAAVEAIFLTTFVLIGQKHLNATSEKWAELGIQISLLTEHEVTKVLTVVTSLAKKLNIEIVADEEIETLSKDIHPDNVLDTMENASL